MSRWGYGPPSSGGREQLKRLPSALKRASAQRDWRSSAIGIDGTSRRPATPEVRGPTEAAIVQSRVTLVNAAETRKLMQSVLRGLTAQQVEQLIQAMVAQKVPAGQALINEGERVSGLMVLLQGRVEIFKHGPDGLHQPLANLDAPTLGRELHCVRKEVPRDLLKSRRVAADRSNDWVPRVSQSYSFGVGSGTHHCNCSFDY